MDHLTKRGLLVAILHRFDRLEALIRQEGDVIMAKIDDAVAAVDDSIDAETVRITAKQNDLAAQIAALQAQVDAGGASQATLDRLAAMKVKLDAINPATPTTV